MSAQYAVRSARCADRTHRSARGVPKPLCALRSAHCALLLLILGCTATNITDPGPGAGGRIYFASNRNDNNFELYSISGDGKALRRLTHDNVHNDRTPVVSPDGRFVAWVRENAAPGGGVTSTEIWIMNSDGTLPKAVVQNSSFNQSPSWTQDGSALVYASFVTGNWEIFRVPVAGGTETNLTNSEFADQNPRVSPDGLSIVFHSNRDLNFEIYSMNLDGGSPTNLSESPVDDRFPNWAPDGRIVWTKFSENNFDLWMMGATGDDPHALTTSTFDENNGSISPDGNSVVFETNRLGGAAMTLFTMPLAGGEARPLTALGGANTGSEIEPWWSSR